LIFDDASVYLFGSGLGGGIIAGTLGVGGGIIYVAIFTSFLRHNLNAEYWGDPLVKYTIANAAFSLSFAGLTASISHIIRKTFHWGPVLITGASGIIGAIGVTLTLSSVTYNPKLFAVIFSALLVPMIVRMLFTKTHDTGLAERSHLDYLIPIGMAAGVVMGLSGLGGGIVLVPMLSSVCRLPIKKAISVSLGALTIAGAGLTVFNVLTSPLPDVHYGPTLGPVILPMALPVVAGVLIGAPIGVDISKRLRPSVIRGLFVVVCLSVITKLFVEFVL
jgi:uncharacterized membrane protein YfcA